MKCYNCDSIITMQSTCPVCKTKIDKMDYELESTKKILKNVNTIKEFANFIGLFYVKSYFLLIAGFAALIAAFWFLFYGNAGQQGDADFMQWNRVVYMILALIFILCFNFYLEMKKVEAFYKDYQRNNNIYYIIWPFKTEYRSIIGDANEKIPNQKIMEKRHRAYEKRDKEVRLLRFNSFKLFHPQKPKLFNSKKHFFTRHFSEEKAHYLKTNNYNDESYVLAEGTIHGFLVMANSVITIFNTPKITKQVLNNSHLLDDNFDEKKGNPFKNKE